MPIARSPEHTEEVDDAARAVKHDLDVQHDIIPGQIAVRAAHSARVRKEPGWQTYLETDPPRSGPCLRTAVPGTRATSLDDTEQLAHGQEDDHSQAEDERIPAAHA